MSDSKPLILKLFKSLILFIIIATAILLGLYYWLIILEDPIANQARENSVFLVEGKLIREKETRKINYISYDQMPLHLINSFVAMEDARFFHHSGFDLIGVMRAFVINLASQKVTQGGSTITQQLAKNLFLEHSRTLERKLMEFRIALALENEYSKEDILEMYLNQIYFGHGNWGIEQAANSYFNKDVSQLTLGEAALLAGIIQAPNAFAPVSGWETAKSRQKIVLERMQELDYINAEEFESAINKSNNWM